MGRGSNKHGPGLALLRWSGAKDMPGVRISPRATRVWDGGGSCSTGPGKPVHLQTAAARRAARLKAQKIGERFAVAYLRHVGDTEVARVGGTSIPFDVLTRQHAVEVKASLSTNEGGSQQWRCTFSAAKGQEIDELDEMDEGEKAEHFESKRRSIMRRKAEALEILQAVMPVQPVTLGLIVDISFPWGVDVYWFHGFHLRIGWQSPGTRAAFRGSFTVEEESYGEDGRTKGTHQEIGRG